MICLTQTICSRCESYAIGHPPSIFTREIAISIPHLPSLPSDAKCRIRAGSSLSTTSVMDREDEAEVEASLRGGRSLSDPIDGWRKCFFRPKRLLDFDDGVGGLDKCASYACFYSHQKKNK